MLMFSRRLPGAASSKRTTPAPSGSYQESRAFARRHPKKAPADPGRFPARQSAAVLRVFPPYGRRRRSFARLAAPIGCAAAAERRSNGSSGEEGRVAGRNHDPFDGGRLRVNLTPGPRCRPRGREIASRTSGSVRNPSPFKRLGVPVGGDQSDAKSRPKRANTAPDNIPR